MAIPYQIHSDANRREIDLPFKVDRATVTGTASSKYIFAVAAVMSTAFAIAALLFQTVQAPADAGGLWVGLAGVVVLGIGLRLSNHLISRYEEMQVRDRTRRSHGLYLQVKALLTELGFKDADTLASRLAFNRGSHFTPSEDNLLDAGLIWLDFRKFGTEQRLVWLPAYKD